MEGDQYAGVGPTNAPNWTMLNPEPRDDYLTTPVFFCFGESSIFIILHILHETIQKQKKGDCSLGYSDFYFF
jgi:hypothetical protein